MARRCREVVIDTLTGEWKLLRADVLHDAGHSLNPAIDIGQVEGGFIQGMGWLTTEELVVAPDDGGKLLTHARAEHLQDPDRQRLPAGVQRARCSTNRRTSRTAIHRSKAVGEPPLLLPFSVFFAIRDAVSAVGGHRVDPPLRAPATSEAILDAIDAVQARADAMDRDTRLAAMHWLARSATPAVVVEVVAARGSAPRGAGTRMLVVGRRRRSARSAAAISS